MVKDTGYSVNYSDMVNYDPESIDTMFMNIPEDGLYTKLYGYLPDTSKFLGVIIYSPASSYVPSLITYSKKGVKIAEEGLILYGCGGGVASCSSTGIIGPELELYLADSVDLFHPDKNRVPFQGDEEYYTVFRKGRILPDGTIKLSPERKINLLATK